MIIQNKIFVVNECRNILRELMIKSVVIFLLKKNREQGNQLPIQYLQHQIVPYTSTWNTVVLIKNFSVGIVQYQFFMP